MKKLFGTVLVASTAVLAAQSPSVTRADQAEVVKDNNAFALDLYAQLRTQSGNLFFAPESLSTTFAMTYAGARGETATEIGQVFHFTLPPERLHPAMAELLAGMNDAHEGYTLRLADALWVKQGLSYLPGYVNLLQTDYGATPRQADFTFAPDAARAAINDWAASQTQSKIQDLIAPDTLSPATLMVLADAIYFNGKWVDAFDPAATQPEDFHLSSKLAVRASMMHRIGNFNYYESGSFQAVELPYQGGDLALVVIEPNRADGLPALERSLTPANLSKWMDKLAPAPKVDLTLPRFSMAEDFDLSDALGKLGMPGAFSSTADFSGMSDKQQFQISTAVHKACLDVNESGTEAAAATATAMVGTSMTDHEQTILLHIDHPFLFAIRDVRNGSLLFLGRVIDPTK